MYDYARTRLYYASTHNNVYICIRVPTLSRTIVFLLLLLLLFFVLKARFSKQVQQFCCMLLL